MALLAVVLFFILLAGLALFLAFSGGPAGARKRVESRRGRQAARTIAFAGRAGPARRRHPGGRDREQEERDSIPEAGVRKLTELQKHGRELFGQRCKQCHTLAAANANAKIGPNLDQLHPQKGLVLDAIKNGRARGNGQMPAQIVEGEDAEAVAQFVAVAVGNEP